VEKEGGLVRLRGVKVTANGMYTTKGAGPKNKVKHLAFNSGVERRELGGARKERQNRWRYVSRSMSQSRKTEEREMLDRSKK